MPQDQDFKRLVRQRVAETGERYTSAHAALTRATPPTRPPDPEVVRRWIELLASPDENTRTFDLLKALPHDVLRVAALDGLAHESWKVRRRCCRLLDDVMLTEESTAALQARLDDEHPGVRKAAMHSLSCVHCKPDGCALDLRPLLERMSVDFDVNVRQAAIAPLEWNPVFVESWVVALLEHVRHHDPSSRLRESATKGLARIARQERTDAERRQLPQDLRRKTERHVGKWVAVADGRIVSASVSLGTIRKQTREAAQTDAVVYWVASG